MRTLALLPALALLLPTALGHSALPLSFVQNGGFEQGLAGWVRDNAGAPNANLFLSTPGAEGSATAVTILNGAASQWLKQRLPRAVDGAAFVLDWSAKVVARPAAACAQTIRVVDALEGGPLATPAIFVAIGFGGTVSVTLWRDAAGAATVPMPTPGEWHHYQLVVVAAVGVGILSIDGVTLAVATGDPAGAPVQVVTGIGDTAGNDAACGAAPDVAWDEIYLGPLV